MIISATDISCPIEATYIALLRNIDGENAHTFAQQTQAMCSADNGYKTSFIVDSIERCANVKGINLGPNWGERMKQLILQRGFPFALNTVIINDMIAIGYPYTYLSKQEH